MPRENIATVASNSILWAASDNRDPLFSTANQQIPKELVVRGLSPSGKLTPRHFLIYNWVCVAVMQRDKQVININCHIPPNIITVGRFSICISEGRQNNYFLRELRQFLYISLSFWHNQETALFCEGDGGFSVLM